jgi:hypothetical protein
MSSNTHGFEVEQFLRRPYPVEAVLVTEENMAAVAKWCQGDIRNTTDGKYIKVRVHRPLNERQTKAFPGDRILYAGTGYKVYTPNAFDKSFMKADAPEELRTVEVPAQP